MSGFEFTTRDLKESSCNKNPHVDNLYLEYNSIKEKLVEHVLEHLGYSVDYLHSHPDTVKQLQKELYWQKFNCKEDKDYLSYRGKRIGHVELVFKDLSYFVEGVIYDNVVI